jgi:hypothetical protein
VGTAGTQYTVTFGANDTFNPVVTMDVVLNVIAPNAPPTWNPAIPTPQAVSHGGNLAFSVTAVDPEADAIALSVVPLWPGMTFTDNGNGTGDFDYTPEFDQGGTLSVTFRAADPYNVPTEQVVDIVVSGNGDGTFTEYTPSVAYATSGFGIDSGDLNADGNIDLIAPDYDTGAVNGVFVFLGDGLGGFTQTTESPYLLNRSVATEVGSRHPELGDFDGDGVLDFAIPTISNGDLYVFTGDAPGGTPDGTFTENVAASIIGQFANSEAHHCESADLDADGDLDIVLVPHSVNTLVRVLVNDGTGMFTVSAQGPLESSPGGSGLMHVGIGDFTNDGIPDFVTSHFQDAVARVFVGNDDGTGKNSTMTFTLMNEIATPVSTPGLPALADYNGDGNLDVVLPHFGDPAYLTIWRGNGFGILAEAATRPSFGNASEYCATSDFDGDGVSDVAATSVNTDGLHIFLGNGDASFTEEATSPYTIGNDPRVITVNDFNNDNIADMAINTWNGGGTIHIMLGN